MLSKSPDTFQELAGSVDAIRLDCTLCDQTARFHVERLLDDLGTLVTVTSWKAQQAAECRHATSRAGRPCGMRFTHLD
jgi:hypothetical protein